MIFTILDCNGIEWKWNGKRLYCVEAEEADPIDNGYRLDSLEEAIDFLLDGYGSPVTITEVK